MSKNLTQSMRGQLKKIAFDPVFAAELKAGTSASDSIMRNMADSLRKQENEALDNFLLHSLKTKAFPKLIGKPNRFSFKWRGIKLKSQRFNSPRSHTKHWLYQFNRKIGEITINHFDYRDFKYSPCQKT